MKRFLIVSILIMLVLFTGVTAFAQSETGRLFGTVTDPSGAAIPDATIKVTDVATNRAVSVQSQGDGSYVINALPIGNYKVEANKQSFKPESANFALQISEVKQVNFKLEVGSAQEVVEVTNAIPVVDTATSSAGEVIEGRQVVDLPLNGRNFTTLALLTPGVSRGQYSNNASAPSNNAETWRNSDSGAAALAVDGLRPQTNNFMLDGIDNNDSMVNSLVIFPAIEDIAEFKTTTSTPPAEFGRAGGGVIQVATKSGTNDIHGAFYWFNRSKIAAADVFNYTSTPQSQPELSRNQFGASLGGPIWKNRVFAFVDYQGWRQNTPAGITQGHVPTTLMREGNFSELLSSAGTGTATSVPIQAICPNLYDGSGNVLSQFSAGLGYVYNPQTCLPFGWSGGIGASQVGNTQLNIVPNTSQNSAGMNYLNAFPMPNIAGADLTTNSANFQGPSQNVVNMDDYDARLDFVATSRDTLFARYSLGDDFLNNTPWLKDSSHFLPSGNGTNPSHPRQVAVGYTHIISNTVLNEFHYGYIRDYYGYQQPGYGQPLAANLGIANANTSPLLGGMALIGGWFGNLSYSGDYGPYLVLEPTHQFTDALSWTKGKHTFKFGGSIIHRDVNWVQANIAKGYFFWDDNNAGCCSSPMLPNTSGHGMFTGSEGSEIAAGFVGAYQVGAFNGYYDTRSWENGFFAQDDFRVNQRLTLNLGLRYDLFTWPSEASNHQSNFNPATGLLVEAGKAPGWNSALIDTPTKNFGPRIGLAYDPHGDGKTVFRAGYGLFYYLDRGGVANQLSENPDFNGTQSYLACPTAGDCSAGYRITLSGAAPAGSTDPTVATGTLPAKIGIDPNSVNSTDNVVYYPKNSPNSHIQEWNLQVERALDSKTSVVAAYVGTKVGNLATPFNANSSPVGGGNSWFPVGGAINPNGVGTISEYAMIGSGHYNGLQAKVTRRMADGLTATASYTLSHAIDNSADTLSNAPTGVVVGANGTALLHYQHGNSDNDQRQLFTASTIYELPFGHGKMFAHDVPTAADYIIGGWEWNNVLVLASGTPFDVTGASSLNGRPDYNGGCKTNVSAFQWITCPSTAFTTPAAGVPGNLPRNFFPGPGTLSWDTSMIKNFSITERVKMQLRFQAYNVTNTPAFQMPEDHYTYGNFGQLRSVRLSPTDREFEFAGHVSF